MDIEFEILEPRHGEEAMAIFNHYVENGFAAYPEDKLPTAAFGKMLEMADGHPAFALVDAASGKLAGFCFMRAFHPLPVFRETAELSYFLAPEATGKGLGALALRKLEEEAAKTGVRRLLAGISSENGPSLKFHLKHGFTECGRFHQVWKKRGRRLDMVWMEKAVSGDDAP